MGVVKKLIVTADDFGLTSKINQGIAEAHKSGVVTATALLANGLASEEAVSMLKAMPNLQVGIHLSIVEGYSLRGVRSSLTDEINYFGGMKPCLHRSWKTFIPRYLLGQISLKELKEEFYLQAEWFESRVGKISFLNGTQHLHILPGISSLVIQLCKDFKIPFIRTPATLMAEDGSLFRKLISVPYSIMGRVMRFHALRHGVKSSDYFGGFFHSGSMNEDAFKGLILKLKPGLTEIMLHPGQEERHLREILPDSYREFSWENELAAACSSEVKELLNTENIFLQIFQ